MYATDIESCVTCSVLVFPGDEIYVEKGQLQHAFHVDDSFDLGLPYPRVTLSL